MTNTHDFDWCSSQFPFKPDAAWLQDDQFRRSMQMVSFAPLTPEEEEEGWELACKFRWPAGPLARWPAGPLARWRLEHHAAQVIEKVNARTGQVMAHKRPVLAASVPPA